MFHIPAISSSRLNNPDQTQANDYERKIHDIVAAFEQEKFELQKQNTKNMEDLLTETNERLTTMEADYAKEADGTACIVKDLENRWEDLFF